MADRPSPPPSEGETQRRRAPRETPPRGAEKDPPGSCVPGWALCYTSGSQSLGKSGNNSVVECDLAKVEVAGSNPVSRSNLRRI
jgi:hypothetical protein